MPQENISEYLNPYRFPRMAFGLKANSTLNRITLTPSNANPGETLYIEIPKLSENMVIVPGSVFLVFNLTISGHENNAVVNNISRSLVKRQRVVFGGESLQDTTNYDLFQTYHDLFLPKEERENMLRHGISSDNMRKLRTNAGDKDTSNAKEVAMAALHNTKYCIPEYLESLGKGVGGALKIIGKKIGEILPGMIGAIASFVFKTAGEAVGFLAKNAWLILAAVMYLIEKFKK